MQGGSFFSKKLNYKVPHKVCNARPLKTCFLPAADDYRPYLTVQVLNVNVCGLLDCGAACSILGANAHIKFLNLKIQMLTFDRPRVLRVADGVDYVCRFYMNLPIQYKGEVQLVLFHIVPEIKLPIHFGINFWQAFNLAPDVLACLPADVSSTETFVGSVEEDGLRNYEELSPQQKRELDSIKQLFDNINTDKVGLGCTPLIQHVIDTGDARPIKQKYYRLSPERLKYLDAELDRMLKNKVVERSYGEWNSPLTLVPKANGEVRLCLDSRRLNAVSKTDAYPLPYINYIIDNLRDAKYLTSLDLSAAYHQIPLHPDSKEKTAFTVPGRGLFHYNRMCFGLVGASATMQRLMDSLFAAEFDNKVFAYIDDIVICTSSFEEHVDILRRVYGKLKDANLTINMQKSQFCRSELKYLGYMVDRFGLRTDPSKVEVIMNFPIPREVKELKRFLGMAGWYRRFIKNFSQVARPLTRLTSKKCKFEWTPEANDAFNTLKSALITAPILKCPDFSIPFYIHTDGSSFAIGGMLAQRIDGVDHPVAYCSRTLNAQEVNYTATERELLAVIYALEQYRPYVEGSKCYIVTDHASLKWFYKLKNPTGRLNRWACRLSQFDFEIIHRKGKEHVIPDTLSRIKVDSISFDPRSVQDPWYAKVLKGCSDNPRLFPNFTVTDGKLFRLSKNKYSLTSRFDWKLVVPSEHREEILRQYHDEPTSGHFGVAKTHKRISADYFWPNLYADVEKYVAACEVCKCYKPANTARAGLMGNPRVVTKPWEAISCDILGPFPPSYARNQYLFVCVDYFSKFSYLFPLRNVTAKAVVKCLEKGVFLQNGVCKYIYVDNGPQFISRDFRELMTKYNVPNIFYNPRYHPQTNQTERLNRDIVRAIASYVRSDHRKWDQNIPEIQCALNTVVHESTKFTPFYLNHGREMVLDGALLNLDVPVDPVSVVLEREPFSSNLSQLRSIYTTVQGHLRKAYTRNVKYYNLRKRPIQFEEGQIIYKRCFPLSNASKYFSAKLSPKYEKCVISTKHGPLVYSLKSMEGKPLGKFHIKDLLERGEDRPQGDPPE